MVCVAIVIMQVFLDIEEITMDGLDVVKGVGRGEDVGIAACCAIQRDGVSILHGEVVQSRRAA